MTTLVYYVCDCCGNQSLQLGNFNTPALAGAVANLVQVTPPSLLCNECCTALGNVASTVMTQRLGINKGVVI